MTRGVVRFLVLSIFLSLSFSTLADSGLENAISSFINPFINGGKSYYRITISDNKLDDKYNVNSFTYEDVKRLQLADNAIESGEWTSMGYVPALTDKGELTNLSYFVLFKTKKYSKSFSQNEQLDSASSRGGSSAVGVAGLAT